LDQNTIWPQHGIFVSSKPCPWSNLVCITSVWQVSWCQTD